MYALSLTGSPRIFGVKHFAQNKKRFNTSTPQYTCYFAKQIVSGSHINATIGLTHLTNNEKKSTKFFKCTRLQSTRPLLLANIQDVDNNTIYHFSIKLSKHCDNVLFPLFLWYAFLGCSSQNEIDPFSAHSTFRITRYKLQIFSNELLSLRLKGFTNHIYCDMQEVISDMAISTLQDIISL